MTFWLVVIIAAVLLAAILAFYLNMTAGRIDRLHRRIDVALLSLDSHLLRRSGVTLELAASGFLDPASSLCLFPKRRTQPDSLRIFPRRSVTRQSLNSQLL